MACVGPQHHGGGGDFENVDLSFVGSIFSL